MRELILLTLSLGSLWLSGFMAATGDGITAVCLFVVFGVLTYILVERNTTRRD